jgi:hypothetical protein
MSNQIHDPSQYSIDKLTIKGKDVTGLFVGLSLYENIYIPAITGAITLYETDGAEFLEKEGIEFTEEIEIEFKNALDEQFKFKGNLNGLKNEATKESKKMYSIDFGSKYVRKNEESFVTKRFKNMNPEQIVKEVLEKKLGVEGVELKGKGIPMEYLGSRKKPFDVIKYVMTHGVSQDGKPDATNGSGKTGKTKGTTGFLCWETMDGFRFTSIDQLLKGEGGEKHEGYKKQLNNRSLDMETTMKTIPDYEFPRIGDTQSKMRSGCFRNVNVTLDMDKGEYVEYTYEDDENMTDNQKEVVKKPTRYLCRVITNERHKNDCEKAKPDTGDQSRKYLAQNVVRQNTFDDQLGEFTLFPQFKMRAGDTMEVKIGKVKSEKEGGYDKKHSGNYVIKGIGHHFTADGHAYTRVSTIRSTTQQDDKSSQQ